MQIIEGFQIYRAGPQKHRARASVSLEHSGRLFGIEKIADGCQRDISLLLEGHMALAAQSKRNVGHSRRRLSAGLKLALTSAAER